MFATFSARCRLSTATMSASPRALSAFTRFAPMNPAAPVTTSVMSPRSCVVGEAREELFAMHDRGPELADDDARRVVRDPHGRAQVGARGHHEREKADHGVARAAHVVDLAGARGLVPALARGEERHALLAPRHDERVELELGAQLLRTAREVLLVLPAPRNLAEFDAVRREEGRAPVARVVPALRVDEHGLAVAAREGDHLLHALEAALPVVGKHDRVGAVHEPLVLVELRLEHLVAGRALEVDAQELLLLADDAQLHRRGE